MDSVDGSIFYLAHFVRKHEAALANAVNVQRQSKKNGQQRVTAAASQSAESLPLHQALTRSYLPLSRSVKPAKLTLTPHHLYFLLSKFEETLGIDIGPLNVRLENLQHDAPPANYVSFLGHAPRSKGSKQTDTDSLRSMSSMHSVMSSMSQLWSSVLSSNSSAKAEKHMIEHKKDITYLYSSITKLPALKLSPDSQTKLVEGFEEFPFDTSVPLLAFKNVSSLEICDLDFRHFYGWDKLADQLHILVLRRAHVDDPMDLLHHIVLDDIEGRRKRSFKGNLPNTPSTPSMPWPSSSPRFRSAGIQRTWSSPHTPVNEQRRSSVGSPTVLAMAGSQDSSKKVRLQHGRQRSDSPTRPFSARQGSLTKRPHRGGSVRQRNGSGGSSESSANENTTPRLSTTDLLSGILPPSKWQFLRHLSLADNGLTHLNTPSLAPVAQTLQSLDLSGNLFTEVPDALGSLTNLRALNLSDCMIDSLRSLSRSPLPAIEVFNLRSNRLVSLSAIEKLPSLRRVDLRDNRLRDPTELARLTTMPDIVDLYVVKNPFTRTHPNYRVTIFNLFRSTPGHSQDVVIDFKGPEGFEKPQLADRTTEQPSKPAVSPLAEGEDEPRPPITGAPMEDELRAMAPHNSDSDNKRHSHRRTTSDFGPRLSQVKKKKRQPPSRLVHLTEMEQTAGAISPTSTTPARPAQQRHQPVPDLGLSRTPTESDTPTTPGQTPYHTAPTTIAQQRATSPATRPTLDTNVFTSPTRGAPKIHNPSDDDDSPLRSPQDLGHSEFYKQRVEALKGELGPAWLAGLKDGREEKANDREVSAVSRASIVRAESGRTLGKKMD